MFQAHLSGGFFPGCVYLVSSWYTRYETNSRMAVFYLTSMVISGFSNIIGYGMSLLNGTAGLIGWQWGESSFPHR
jgi:MFS family permease